MKANHNLVPTNVFMIIGGRAIYIGRGNTPWMVFQCWLPDRKLDFLFGAN